MKKLLFLLLALCVPVMAAPTYFCYSDVELCQLKGAPVDHCLKEESLKKWDEIALDEAEDLPYFKRLRIFTYLYVAQAEVAGLACKTKGQLYGSIDPVSDAVLQLFFPDYDRPDEYEEDTFSKEAAEIVIAKIRPRIECEDESPCEYKVPEEHKDDYTVALFTAKWRPWHLKRACAYWPCPPAPMDREVWKREVEQIKAIKEPMTEEKQEAIHYWAGTDNMKDGDWRIIANDFMVKYKIPLDKMFTVRSTLMRAMYDGAIVCFSAKYHYMVMRPKAYDESVDYELDCPAHPSYPSGHSTESTIAACVLSHYFPGCKKYWHHMANEACYSRIWGGIHYPADDRAGRQSGRKVAKQVLRRFVAQRSN